jgi:maleylacetoacetate isomerase
MSSEIKLYGYWRSSASWRVRWALELKKISYAYAPVNLLKGENKDPAYLKINPAGRVPTLEIEGQTRLTQSVAMLEWIEETQVKGHPLLPKDALTRAHVRTLTQIINADTAPLQMPLVQNAHSSDADEKKKWAQLFIRRGLRDFEEASKNSARKFSVGDTVTMADLFLIPQIYNAIRYEIPVNEEFPTLTKIYETALSTPECQKASPEKQPDAPK